MRPITATTVYGGPKILRVAVQSAAWLSGDQAAPRMPQGLVGLFQRAESAAPGGAFFDAMVLRLFWYADSRDEFVDTTAR